MNDSTADATVARDLPKWKGILQLAIMVIVIGAAIFFARAPSREFLELESPEGLARMAPTASVIKPVRTSAAHSVVLTGTVGTLGNVKVIPEATGDIVYVAENFRNGGEFRAGELLAQVDTTTYELRLERAKLALEFAQAELREVLDKQSRGNLSLARNPRGDIELWMDLEGEVEQAESRVEMAKIGVRLMEIELDETRISMPFDGYVKATKLSVGQVVKAQEHPIGEVYAKDELRVRVPIPVHDLNSLQPVVGRAAEVTVDGRMFQTEVERVSSRVDIETRLASLYLKVLDQEGAEQVLRPGSFADVVINGPLRENLFVLPEASMQINGRVWLVDDGALLSYTPESVGFSGEGWLVVAFDPKDGVVVGSVSGAREGLGVNPVAAQI